MEEKRLTYRRILDHAALHPGMQVRDLHKFLFQSSFGCEHMAGSPAHAAQFIAEEASKRAAASEPLTERLDGAYSRVDLAWLEKGLSPETLASVFCLSAKKEENGLAALEQKLSASEELVRSGAFSFGAEAFLAETAAWKAQGYPAVRHTEHFRETYHPAYRVTANRYVRFLPLFAMLDAALKKGPVRLAVEGGSASGKSTLGGILWEVYGCTLFHMDDFFLRPEQRTKERFAEPGGNVDRERFLEEVLLPLSRGEAACYRPFDCGTFSLGDPVTAEAGRLTVVEGAYSMHPDLAPYFDLSLFLDIDADLQKRRILKRNGEKMARRFFEEWIPMERVYFEKRNVRQRCSLVISVEEEE